MTHMTYTPGYQGYLRNFQREYVSGPVSSVPSRKYTDFEVERHGLMADSPWRSYSHTRFDKDTLAANQQQSLNGTTRIYPAHKDSLQAEKRMRDLKQQKQQEESKEETKDDKANTSYSSTFSRTTPFSSTAGPSSSIYGTTYSDSISIGRQEKIRAYNPKFPYEKMDFADGTRRENEEKDIILNKSLAQAISTLPTSTNLLRGSPIDTHGSYTRDYGVTGSSPLQRVEGSSTAAAATSYAPKTIGGHVTYPRGAITHQHIFPSSHLIGPSQGSANSQRVNENPIEGRQVSGVYRPSVTSNGEYGVRPASEGSIGISGMGTTKELFHGSTKSTAVRMPGYSGFIPSSTHNHFAYTTGQLAASSPSSSTAATTTKDNILSTYTHNMAGYTGHNPQSVVNVRGPRTPRGKKRLNEGLVASLILDSMRT